MLSDSSGMFKVLQCPVLKWEFCYDPDAFALSGTEQLEVNKPVINTLLKGCLTMAATYVLAASEGVHWESSTAREMATQFVGPCPVWGN